MRRILLFLSPLAAAGLIWLAVSLFVTGAPGGVLLSGSDPAAAQPAAPILYNAKFVCGTVSEPEFAAGAPVVPGTYKTAVNVHNPSFADSVIVGKAMGVAHREGEAGGPWVMIDDYYVVLPNHAFEIDCAEILSVLVGAGYTYTFVKGFVGIYVSSGAPLDVTAVYTAQHVNAVAGSEGLGQAIDIEPVPPEPFVEVPDPAADPNAYAAKFVCGTSPGPDPVVAGDYASAVNVYNPNEFEVGIRKKVVVAEREDEPFGAISDWREEIVPVYWNDGGAFEVDCPDIRSFFDPPLTGFIKGFVVIETQADPTGGGLFYNGSLDVVPVYTVRRATADPVNGYGMDIEVLRVSGKVKALPPEPTPTPTATPTNTPTNTPTATATPTPELSDLHYKCYEIDYPWGPSPPIPVEDQFGARTETLQDGEYLCNPTDKGPTGNVDLYGVHFEAFRILSGHEPLATVDLTTQFGTHAGALVETAQWLWTPAVKNQSTPSSNLHYVCYNLVWPGQPPNVGWWLLDQFMGEPVQVGAPLYLCAPALKFGEGNLSADHYVCYDAPGGIGPESVWLDTQFGLYVGPVWWADYLCAPAIKTHVMTDEACCFLDGSCVDEDPVNCEIDLGGEPQGPGTTCATVQCPQP